MSNAKIYSLRVKDVMSRDVVTIHADDTIHEAIELMVENRVVALPVVDRRQHCVGMISSSDLLDMTHELDEDLDAVRRSDDVPRRWIIDKLREALGGEPVSGQMTESVAMVGPETPLPEAAREMLRNRVHRLPVVGEGQKLLGIVSTMDLMDVFANGASQE